MSISTNNATYILSNFTVTHQKIAGDVYVYMGCADFDIYQNGKFVNRITVSYHNEDFNELVSRIGINTDPFYEDLIEQEGLRVETPTNTAEGMVNTVKFSKPKEAQPLESIFI